MNDRLCLLCCRSFQSEVEAAVAAEGWSEVTVASFPARCGHPPLDWSELEPLLAKDCSEVVLLGRACLKGLDRPPDGWPKLRLQRLAECFELVAGSTLTGDLIARGGYLMTPSWLSDWRGHLQQLGFAETEAAQFFNEFARELVLLDTGTVADSQALLAELAQAAKLPATRIKVGIDYTRLLLAKIVADWHAERERIRAQQGEQEHARELADHVSAMELLSRIALFNEEQDTIAAIVEMFSMLFGPDELHYVRFDEGKPIIDSSSELVEQVAKLDGDWAYTRSGSGFALRLSWQGEPLGVIVADRFAFAQYRDRYLKLALSIAGVCALAIENARTFRRIKQAESELQQFNNTLEQRVEREVAKNMQQERLLIQQSRLAAMGEMIGNIAHQWRQPLNALSIVLTNIKDDFDFGELSAESMTDSIARARSLIERMSSTIDDFRDFFKPNKEKTVFSLEDSVTDVMSIVGSSLLAHHIEVTRQIAADAQIHGFPNEFAQVLLNIITNAKEAILSSQRRDGLIRIRGERVGAETILTVKNNGGPIPDEVLPKIFDIYFTTKETGTGIGLYMSRTIVENHLGGRIEACNDADGVTFTVACPAAASSP